MSFFVFAARSAVGLVRNGNEDSALASSQLIAVADGMGGHAGGEVASKIAITGLATMSPLFFNSDIDSESADDLYMNSLHAIDGQIQEVALDNPEVAGMGTTLTSLLIRENVVALLHIGDSRAYRLRGNDLLQLSADHTVIQELLSSGAISQSEVATHPQRSVLTQVLMGEGVSDIALQIYDVKSKDRFLLCSDGLTNVLNDKEIKSLIKGKKLDEAATALIEATYINGAPDNVTVVIADVVEEVQSSDLELIGAAQQ